MPKWLVLASMLIGMGCRTPTPIHNVYATAHASTTTQLSTEDVGKAIARAGSSLGWHMDPMAPGHLVGTLQVRTHIAVVDIRFTGKAYTIRYRDSTDLGYDGQSIHPNYNGWVKRLNEAIQIQLLGI